MKIIPVKPLQDIFSKPKSRIRKEIPNIIIQADYREKQSMVPAHLVKLGIEIDFKELKVADFLVNGVAIERKTISDFISSMLNRRLIKQLEEMQQYNSKLLIIEGIDEQELYSDEKTQSSRANFICAEGAKGGWASDYASLIHRRERGRELGSRANSKMNIEPANPKTTNLNPNSVRGFLLSILLKHKVPIIFTKNQKDTAKFIYLIANKQSPTNLSMNVKKKSLNKKEQMQFILEGFPGIGPTTSKKLLQKFKSLKNIFNATTEELQEILGIKAEAFKKIINELF